MRAGAAALTSPRPAPIVRRKLYNEIADRIEAMIHDGQYAVGDSLPSEREIMETFGVGRTSVREALFALQRMGLLTINSGERARVTAPTPKALVSELHGAARYLLAQPEGVRQFQQARTLFEVALARFAAEHAKPKDVAALRAALEANQRAIGNDARFEATDVAFHYVLAEVPHNPIFTALHAAMASWLLEQRQTSIRVKGADRAAYRAHARIFDAIAAHDVDAAEAAMRAHLAQVEKFYWQIRSG
jgi:GntR family transcriptional regulator, sialic acid-inducible nan operon repressor